ncbi:MAG: hypothetical protein IH586_06230, partial [Anaerolineaceae bacterium]|nr:hypothetical protein [Anaerolineaceae bacterium]
MISVPPPILQELAARFGLQPDSLTYLGGGDESSDGIVYAFSSTAGPRVLKIMLLVQNQHR